MSCKHPKLGSCSVCGHPDRFEGPGIVSLCGVDGCKCMCYFLPKTNQKDIDRYHAKIMRTKMGWNIRGLEIVHECLMEGDKQ
jgi:hypothetical protein